MSREPAKPKAATKAPKRKSNAGRPTVYRKEMAEQARKLYARGATDVQVADFFGVSVVTLWRWAHTNEEFCKAQIQGCEDADERVERSLFAKATGYTYDSEKVFCDKGRVIRVKTREHVPPSDTAAIFWLKNRRRERWRDKQEIEHGGTESIVKILEEIAAERAALRAPAVQIEGRAIDKKDEEKG